MKLFEFVAIRLLATGQPDNTSTIISLTKHFVPSLCTYYFTKSYSCLLSYLNLYSLHSSNKIVDTSYVTVPLIDRLSPDTPMPILVRPHTIFLIN